MFGTIAAALLASQAAPAAPAAPAFAEYRAADTLVALDDGRLINLRCTGEGAPTVILEAGAAAYSPAWIGVRDEAAAKAETRVCSYDRSGYGFSDAAPGSRDIGAAAADLDALLAKAKIEAPVVLAGHSLGGLIARLYASRHPGKVAGMVLVDPSVEGIDARLEEIVPGSTAQWERLMLGVGQCAAAAGTGALAPACTPDAMVVAPAGLAAFVRDQLRRPSHYRAAANDLVNATRSEQLVAAAERDLGAMPLVVLTAGDNDLAGAKATPAQHDAARAMWAEMHREVAARSSRGAARVVAGVDHYMMKDDADAVVEAIVAVVAAARAAPEV